MKTNVEVSESAAQKATEALRPLYAKIFPSEPVDQIVLPSTIGPKMILENGGKQADVNGVYALGLPKRQPWAPHFSSSNLANDHGTIEPAAAWVKDVAPVVPDSAKVADPAGHAALDACRNSLEQSKTATAAANKNLGEAIRIIRAHGLLDEYNKATGDNLVP